MFQKHQYSFKQKGWIITVNILEMKGRVSLVHWNILIILTAFKEACKVEIKHNYFYGQGISFPQQIFIWGG